MTGHDEFTGADPCRGQTPAKRAAPATRETADARLDADYGQIREVLDQVGVKVVRSGILGSMSRLSAL
jgi:hypothetical protein